MNQSKNMRKIKSKFEITTSQFNLILDTAQLNFWQWELSSDLITDFGYFKPLFTSSEPCKTKFFITKIHSDDRKDVIEKLTHSKTYYDQFEAEFRIQIAENYEWIAMQGQFLPNVEGRSLIMQGIWRLISEEKNYQTLIQLQQLLLTQLLTSRYKSENHLTSEQILTPGEYAALARIWKNN
ncbi:MAG: hypothetical protein H0U70_08490 [Tatlockia sp.]|nr:hypothetical protein [Tatlockia sp.]